MEGITFIEKGPLPISELQMILKNAGWRFELPPKPSLYGDSKTQQIILRSWLESCYITIFNMIKKKGKKSLKRKEIFDGALPIESSNFQSPILYCSPPKVTSKFDEGKMTALLQFFDRGDDVITIQEQVHAFLREIGEVAFSGQSIESIINKIYNSCPYFFSYRLISKNETKELIRCAIISLHNNGEIRLNKNLSRFAIQIPPHSDLETPIPLELLNKIWSSGIGKQLQNANSFVSACNIVSNSCPECLRLGKEERQRMASAIVRSLIENELYC